MTRCLLSRTSYLSGAWLLCILSAAVTGCRKAAIHPGATKTISTGTTDDLKQILFLNGQTGFAAGGDLYQSAVIVATADGGNHWGLNALPPPADKAIYGLCRQQNMVYACAFDGKIYKKDISAATWTFIQTPIWEWFRAIDFASGNKGFIATGKGFENGRLLQIDSSGSVLQKDSFEFALYDVQFATETLGYACGYGAVLKTSDGGASWKLQPIAGDAYRSISCPDDQNVWIVGYNGSIIHSPDGGAHWEKQRNGNNFLLERWRFHAVQFQDATTGVAVGDKGLAVMTRDGGATWKKIETGTKNDLFDLTFQPSALWISGARGLLLKIEW